MSIPAELESGDPLIVADGSGANPRETVPPAKKVHIHNPVWSLDGQWIYFARGQDPFGAMDVWRVRPGGGSLEQLTHQSAAVNFIAPLDARTLLYVARAADWSGPWLWSRRRGDEGHAPRVRRPRPIHLGIGQPRRPPRRRHRLESRGQPVEGTGARPGSRRSRRAALSLTCANESGAGPALLANGALLPVRPRNRRGVVEAPGWAGIRSPQRRGWRVD